MTHANHFALKPIAILLAATLPLAAQAKPTKDKPAPAVVTDLSGRAWFAFAKNRIAPHKTRIHIVELYDWVPENTIVHVPSGSFLEITFMSGKRYKLTGEIRTRITAVEAAQVPGVEELPQVQVMKTLPGIDNMQEGESAGIVRVRASQIGGLYPAPLKVDDTHTLNTVTLPDHTVLRFMPDPHAESYQVVITNESGAEIFQSKIASHEVAICPGVLRAGQKYSWHVTASTALAEIPSEEVSFRTLSAHEIAMRSAWQKASEQTRDPNVLAAMSGIDYRLGLFAEAREEIQAASQMIAQTQH